MPSLSVGGKTIPLTAVDALFYRFDTSFAQEAYIMKKELRPSEKNTVKIGDDLLEGCVAQFLDGNLKLYRGIPRWHPLFPDVLKREIITPLGNGKLPDFSGKDTSFVPFSPDLQIASLFAATSYGGFDASDRIEFVYGYNKSDFFRVGMLVSRKIAVSEAIGFMNAGEIQVRGPATITIDRIYNMETPVWKIWAGTPQEQAMHGVYGGKTIGEAKMPELASDGEKREYILKYGMLRHTPEAKKPEMTRLGIDWYLQEASLAEKTTTN